MVLTGNQPRGPRKALMAYSSKAVVNITDGWLLNQFQHLEAVYFGHLHVQKYKVGLVLLYGFKAFKTIAAFLQHFYLREKH